MSAECSEASPLKSCEISVDCVWSYRWLRGFLAAQVAAHPESSAAEWWGQGVCGGAYSGWTGFQSVATVPLHGMWNLMDAEALRQRAARQPGKRGRCEHQPVCSGGSSSDTTIRFHWYKCVHASQGSTTRGRSVLLSQLKFMSLVVALPSTFPTCSLHESVLPRGLTIVHYCTMGWSRFEVSFCRERSRQLSSLGACTPQDVFIGSAEIGQPKNTGCF